MSIKQNEQGINARQKEQSRQTKNLEQYNVLSTWFVQKEIPKKSKDILKTHKTLETIYWMGHRNAIQKRDKKQTREQEILQKRNAIERNAAKC